MGGAPFLEAIARRVAREEIAMADARRSYRGLLALPAFGLFDAAGELVATIRAHDATEARDLFRQYGMKGARVKRLDTTRTMGMG